MAQDDRSLDGTKRLMGALVRHPPTPHNEMKPNNKTNAIQSRPKNRVRGGSSAKPKNA